MKKTYANDWEQVNVGLLDITAKSAVLLANDTSFQPYFSGDGTKLAYVKADTGSYRWAQTWSVCVRTNMNNADTSIQARQSQSRNYKSK